MPLKSKAQLRACFAQQKKDRDAGKKKVQWDCHKMYKDTKVPFKELPEYVVYTGSKGGLYILKNGKKVYVKDK
jgi:hypothetical protein